MTLIFFLLLKGDAQEEKEAGENEKEGEKEKKEEGENEESESKDKVTDCKNKMSFRCL